MQDFDHLYQKFLNRQCSREEAERLLAYFREKEGDAPMQKLVEEALERADPAVLSKADERSVTANEKKVMSRIRPVSTIRYYLPRIAAAAVVFWGFIS